MKRPPRIYPVWTDEEKHRVEKMLLEGMNPKAIGAALNRPRNAICGMIFRTDFLRDAQQERVARMSHGDRYRFLFKSRSEGSTIPEATFVAPPSSNLRPDAYDARALKIRLIDLASDQCKYIPGNDRLFCGYPVAPDSVYCVHHTMRCKADRHVKGKERPIGWGS